MIITTSRLLLRPWQRADLDALADLPPYPDPLDDDWNWPHALRENGTADFFFLGRACDPNRAEWMIIRPPGQVIGHLGIRDIDRDARSARLGMGLAAPYVGMGYGSEALRTFLDSFFGPLEFQQMLLEVRAHNQRARRLYERLGFREVESYWQIAGTAEACRFLLAPEYDAVRSEFRLGRQHTMVRCLSMRLSVTDWPPDAAEREAAP